MVKKIVLYFIIFCVFYNIFVFAQAAVEENKAIVSLDYKDTELWQIFRDIAEQTNINFVLDKEIQDKKITVYFNDVLLKDALEAIARIAQIKYELLHGVYQIYSRDNSGQ